MWEICEFNLLCSTPVFTCIYPPNNHDFKMCSCRKLGRWGESCTHVQLWFHFSHCCLRLLLGLFFFFSVNTCFGGHPPAAGLIWRNETLGCHHWVWSSEGQTRQRRHIVEKKSVTLFYQYQRGLVRSFTLSKCQRANMLIIFELNKHLNTHISITKSKFHPNIILSCYVCRKLSIASFHS